MNRRGFIGAILAAASAPAIVRADSLMRIVPRDTSFIIETAEGNVETFLKAIRGFEGLKPGDILRPVNSGYVYVITHSLDREPTWPSRRLHA